MSHRPKLVEAFDLHQFMDQSRRVKIVAEHVDCVGYLPRCPLSTLLAQKSSEAQLAFVVARNFFQRPRLWKVSGRDVPHCVGHPCKVDKPHQSLRHS
jgi:hypothetical protein